MREIKYIAVHCTATQEGKDYPIEEIERWHKERGFKSIGYHYVVGLNGNIMQGRKESEAGAHVQNYNANSIAVCYIGGLDTKLKAKDTRTAEQKKALVELLATLKIRYPRAIIQGHRDFPNVAKDCPSFDAKKEYLSL